MDIILIIIVIVTVLLIYQTMTKISFGELNDTRPPSVNITYPAYPPTITTGKIILQGTANDSESGIKTVSAAAHVFPFNGNFSINLPSSTVYSTKYDWAHWSVPLLINTTGTYRVVIAASDNSGNDAYTETTINAVISPPGATGPKIAFVRPSFTEAAYQDHGFYTFYFKYKFPPFGKKITTDLDMLTVKTPPSVAEENNATSLRQLSNLTALVSSDPDQQEFWIPFIDHLKRDVPTGILTVMRDEDVNDGHIFNADNKTNAYDILLLFHDEYATQNQYNNLRRFVSNGGTIVFIDSNVFYAQIRYDRDNHSITLVKGHDWEFDGKAATRGVSERWYNETKDWVGANWLVNSVSDKITFANNPFNYTHFEEQFVNNAKDKIILDYGIKFPKDYLATNVFPPGKENGKITVATYSLQYGKGKVIMTGLFGQKLARNELFLNFFDNIIKPLVPAYAK
jgi:hypothetical protein